MGSGNNDNSAMRRPTWAGWACVAMAATALGACGGGGSDTPVSTSTGPPLAVGRRISFQVTDTDNANNTIPWQLDYTVLSVATDGSYTQSMVGNGGNVQVNGSRYGTVNQVLAYNAQHQQVSYTVQGSTPLLCSYTAAVPPLPLSLPIGQAWPDTSSHADCASGAAFDLLQQNGQSVADESLSVPAGRFAARKVHYTVSTTILATGAQRIGDVSAWYDHASGYLVRSDTSFSYPSATPTTGYLVHEVKVLLTPP